MRTLRHALLAASAALAASGLAPAQALAETHSQGQPGLYATKAEAEAAAKRLNCSGAHPMGDQWMPCSTHPSPSGHGAHMNH